MVFKSVLFCSIFLMILNFFSSISFILVITLLIGLVLIPLISAYTWGYGNPIDYLENEWVKFIIIFVVLFACVYTFFKNRTQNNKGVSAIAGIGISLILSMAVVKRGYLDRFLNENIVDWVLIIALLIIL